MILAKETGDRSVRIHGPQKMKQFLDLVRPAVDTEFGSNQYPVDIEERTYDASVHEDYAVKVRYLPLFSLGEKADSDVTAMHVDVAYLVELKVRM